MFCAYQVSNHCMNWRMLFVQWFAQVTIAGGFPTHAAKLRDAFFVPVKSAFFKPRDVSLYPVSNSLTKVTICCLGGHWWTLQNWFCSEKVWTVHRCLLNASSKKPIEWKFFHYRQNDWELAVVTFWFLSELSSERIMSSKSLFWPWMPLKKQCILYQIEHCWIFKILLIISKKKDCGRVLLRG